MKLGYGTYGMPQLAVTEAIEQVARIGFDGVELAALPNHPAFADTLTAADRAAVKARLRDCHLALPALMIDLNAVAEDQDAQVAALQANAALALDLAVDTPPVLVAVCGGRPAQWETDRERAADNLARLAAVCEAHGLILAIEPHVGGLLHRPEHAEWVRQRVNSPAIGFNYDESHFQLRGLDVAESARIMVPHAVGTHLKDAAGDADHVTFLLPGDGDFDYPAFFTLLAGLGYNGWLTVEVSGMVWNAPGYDAVAGAARCYATLDGGLQAAGLPRG